MKKNNRQHLGLLLFITFLLITMNILCLDITRVFAETKVEIECSKPWQIAYPGEIVTFNLKIKNLAAEFDRYFLYLNNPSLPNDWTAEFYSGIKEVNVIGINGRQSTNLNLLINIPEDASPKEYNFGLHLEGTFSNASRIFTITIEEIHRKIILESPFTTKSMTPSQSTSFPIKIVNEGETSENLFLSTEINPVMMMWHISFSEEELTIEPKGSSWTTLLVEPIGVVIEDIYDLEAIVKTEDDTLEATISLKIEIVANYLLEIVGTQPINPEVITGEKTQIIVTVMNMGQSPLTNVKLEMNSPSITNIYALPSGILTLDPAETIHFNIYLTPNIYLPTEDYRVEIKAVSDEIQSSRKTTSISITSAIPWFWISIFVVSIITATILSFILKVVSK